MQPAEFHYRIAWRARSAHPGHHPSTQPGGGYEFHGHAPLMSCPDARNLDVRATLHEPFGQFLVRTYRQRSAIPVFAVADLTASMDYPGKMLRLAHVAASVAYSAYRSGDPFGFVGCGEGVEHALLLPPRWSRGAALHVQRSLAGHRPKGRHWRGLAGAAEYLGRQKALVFLISDFHLPLAELEESLRGFAHHDVVPVVLWDESEWQGWPDWGLVRLADSETGAARTVWLRPAVKAKLAEAFAARRAALVDFFDRHGREPFFLDGGFDADALTRYFHH